MYFTYLFIYLFMYLLINVLLIYLCMYSFITHHCVGIGYSKILIHLYLLYISFSIS